MTTLPSFKVFITMAAMVLLGMLLVFASIGHIVSKKVVDYQHEQNLVDMQGLIQSVDKPNLFKDKVDTILDDGIVTDDELKELRISVAKYQIRTY